jgi:hypothetical protein
LAEAKARTTGTGESGVKREATGVFPDASPGVWEPAVDGFVEKKWIELQP